MVGVLIIAVVVVDVAVVVGVVVVVVSTSYQRVAKCPEPPRWIRLVQGSRTFLAKTMKISLV